MTRNLLLRLACIASLPAMALAAPGAIAAAQPTPKSVTFDWAGETFEIDIPAGYCLPTREQQAFADKDAAGDSQNATLAHFSRCGSWGEDYIIIKTPRTPTDIDMSRPDFTAALADAMGQTDALERGKKSGAEDVQRSSEGKVNIVSQDFGYAGFDETCAYLAGTITVSNPVETKKVRTAACITLVGQRGFSLYTYETRPDGANLDTLKQRSLDLALTLTKS